MIDVNCRVPGQAHRVKNCGLHADCKAEGRCVIHATLRPGQVIPVESLDQAALCVGVLRDYRAATGLPECREPPPCASDAFTQHTPTRPVGDFEAPPSGGSRASGPLLDKAPPVLGQEWVTKVTTVDEAPALADANHPLFREVASYDPGVKQAGVMRSFSTGATRSSDAGRIDPEGFMNPLVVERFCEYMNKHRVQADGSTRASDNWQKGMPTASGLKGMWRHFLHLWTRLRGYAVTDPKAAADAEEDVCAIMFNCQVILLNLITERRAR